MADIVVLQGRLAEAETALHQLLTGVKAMSLSYDGKSVSYSQANIGELRAYIASLRHEIGILNGSMPRRGPVHLTF